MVLPITMATREDRNLNAAIFATQEFSLMK
jgi:hypothetical protein